MRTLDALHLAAAQILADSGDDDVVFLTGDSRQSEAAEALGIPLYRRPAQHPPVGRP
jgi:hypothetical protein